MKLKELYAALNEQMADTVVLGQNKEIVIPKLPEAQVIVIPVVREAVAPMLIRNNDADDITDMTLAGKNRVLMIASKTKGVERRNGARILRTLGCGGRYPTNKTYVSDNIREVYDLNTYVFGDSAKSSGKANAIYSVHSAVLYSDAVSLQSRAQSVSDQSRHGGISEDGGAFNPETKQASANIFTTRYVNPGTLFVQTLVITGRRLPPAALDHLLLSVGLAGAYGGQTAVTGTNLRTHLCGIFWGRLEREVNAPGEIMKALDKGESNLDELKTGLEALFRSVYPHHHDSGQLNDYLAELVARFEADDPALRESYKIATEQVTNLFSDWFVGKDDKKKAAG